MHLTGKREANHVSLKQTNKKPHQTQYMLLNARKLDLEGDLLVVVGSMDKTCNSIVVFLFLKHLLCIHTILMEAHGNLFTD